MAMNNLSDIIAHKRIDMETIQRQRRGQQTPRVVSESLNASRPNMYYPNINRTYMTDMTYDPGNVVTRPTHKNSKNRDSSGVNFAEECVDAVPSRVEVKRAIVEIDENLGLRRKHYKHPLSMYEIPLVGPGEKPPVMIKKVDPTLPVHYHQEQQQIDYIGGPVTAGKEWVTNRHQLWNGGSPTTPC